MMIITSEQRGGRPPTLSSIYRPAPRLSSTGQGDRECLGLPATTAAAAADAVAKKPRLRSLTKQLAIRSVGCTDAGARQIQTAEPRARVSDARCERVRPCVPDGWVAAELQVTQPATVFVLAVCPGRPPEGGKNNPLRGERGAECSSGGVAEAAGGEAEQDETGVRCVLDQRLGDRDSCGWQQQPYRATTKKRSGEFFFVEKQRTEADGAALPNYRHSNKVAGGPTPPNAPPVSPMGL